MKLFAIGDSITQGFMSGAAARSDLAYPALIARAMGLSTGPSPNTDFRFPEWPNGGLPINLEVAARRVRKSIGSQIDFWDWPSAANAVRGYLDLVEDYYERGAGRIGAPFSQCDWFHNSAVQGFDVADAWLVTPDLCRDQIAEEERHSTMKDGLFAYPSAAFYRTALNVLDPTRNPANGKLSTIDILNREAAAQGVENLILWLGANNVLGTVVSLNVRATNGPRSNYHSDMTRVEREAFNLWSPADFKTDYRQLIRRVDQAMASNKDPNWRVFVGTVPPVSVAPLAAGVGEPTFLPDPFGVIKGRNGEGAKYFRYYTYFLFDYEFAYKNNMKLTMEQIYQIDSYIAEYRRIIRQVCAAANKAHGVTRYIIVDTCEALLQAAYKRNDGLPTYKWPNDMTARYPMVDTRFHHASRGATALEQGGIFSMDGIHPSAIGQGLIAHEFLSAINQERGASHKLDWKAIYDSDDLFNAPIDLMESVREKAPDFAKFLIWATSLKGRGPRGR